MQEWPQQQHQQQHALASSWSPTISHSNAASDPLQHSSYDADFLINDLAWDQLLDTGFDQQLLEASVPPGFPTPEHELGYDPSCLNLSAPFFDCFPTPPVTSNQTTASAGTTTLATIPPTAAAIQSPSESSTPPGPDVVPVLIAGLKLPEAKPASKPGRRPAALSSSSSSSSSSPSSLSPPPPLSSSDGRVSKRPAAVDPEIISRRQRNNLAAKRYRQKKIDRIQELEDEVARVKEERDELRIRLARQEAEVAALREMLKMKQGGGGGS